MRRTPSLYFLFFVRFAFAQRAVITARIRSLRSAAVTRAQAARPPSEAIFFR